MKAKKSLLPIDILPLDSDEYREYVKEATFCGKCLHRSMWHKYGGRCALCSKSTFWLNPGFNSKYYIIFYNAFTKPFLIAYEIDRKAKLIGQHTWPVFVDKARWLGAKLGDSP